MIKAFKNFFRRHKLLSENTQNLFFHCFIDHGFNFRMSKAEKALFMVETKNCKACLFYRKRDKWIKKGIGRK